MKKIFALVLFLATAWNLGAIPFVVDITTLTTNSRASIWQLSVTNATVPFTNGSATLKNTNFVDIGDSLPVVFSKVNSNFAYLDQFTNGITTNGSAGSGNIPMTTNSAAYPKGYAWVPMPTGGGSQTPWTSDIDAANHALNNINEVGTLNPTVLGVGLFLGGSNNVFNSNFSDAPNEIVGGLNDSISGADGSGIFGGYTNAIGGSGGVPSTGSYIIGGFSNTVSVFSSGHVDFAMILNGWNMWAQSAGVTLIGDRQNSKFIVQTPDMLAIREQNGVGVNTNKATPYALSILGDVNIAGRIFTNDVFFAGGTSGGGGGSGSASNAIANFNGLGTNTTLFGPTYLLASNLTVIFTTNYYPSAGIPVMTATNAPSGFAWSSPIASGASQPWGAFSASGFWDSGLTEDPTITPAGFIEYRFTSPVAISGFIGGFSVRTNSSITNLAYMVFSASSDGANWTTYATNVLAGLSYTSGVTNNLPAYYFTNSITLAGASWFRWDMFGTNTQTSPSLTFNPQFVAWDVSLQMQLNAVSGYVDILTNQPANLMEIDANNGLALNTTNLSLNNIPIHLDNGQVGIHSLDIFGIGPGGGSITFPGGYSIVGASLSNHQGPGDSGLILGNGCGQLLGETFSTVLGATNDVAGGGVATGPFGNRIFGGSILGGINNVIGNNTGFGNWSSIVGGRNNVDYNGDYSAIMGSSNMISGGGENFIVGNSNAITGSAVVAMGAFNHNANAGGFMFNTGDAGALVATGNNQFIAHAAGGFGFNTNTIPLGGVSVSGNSDASSFSVAGAPGITATLTIWTNSAFTHGYKAVFQGGLLTSTNGF